jgi:hypothetical protein
MIKNRVAEEGNMVSEEEKKRETRRISSLKPSRHCSSGFIRSNFNGFSVGFSPKIIGASNVLKKGFSISLRLYKRGLVPASGMKESTSKPHTTSNFKEKTN